MSLKKNKKKDLQAKFLSYQEKSMKGDPNYLSITMFDTHTILNGLSKKNLSLPTCLYISDLSDANCVTGHINSINITGYKSLASPDNQVNPILTSFIKMKKTDLGENNEILTLISDLNGSSEKSLTSTKLATKETLIYFEIEKYSFLLISLLDESNKSVNIFYKSYHQNQLLFNRELLLKLLPKTYFDKTRRYFNSTSEKLGD